MDTEKRIIGEKMLAVFRILLGWLMFWPFLDKMFGLGFETPAGSGFVDGGSPSSFVSYVTSGLFADFFNSLAGNLVIDIVLLAALLFGGAALILGIASKIAVTGTSVFLFVMYLIQVPPKDNPVIDYHIIMIIGLVACYYMGGFEHFSLHEKWKELSIVKKFPILER